MMIDSHAHILTDDTQRYPPAPPSGAIKPGELDNPLTIERLIDAMPGAGVDKAVLVQRGSVYGFDNSYVCDAVDMAPDRLAAVCAINGEADDAADMVRHWVGTRTAVGIRFMELVRDQGIGWLDSPSARQAWRAAVDLDVATCVHFFPWNRSVGLQSLFAILEELPTAKVVIDHFSNMNVDAGPPDYGLDDALARLVEFSGVAVKFTTIPLGKLEKAGVDAAPIVRRIVDHFGANRVMWGSDVSQSPGSYEYMSGLARNSVTLLTEAERSQVLGGTAAALYGRNWS